MSRSVRHSVLSALFTALMVGALCVGLPSARAATDASYRLDWIGGAERIVHEYKLSGTFQEVNLINDGPVPLTVTGIVLDGADALAVTDSGCVTKPVAPGQTCLLRIGVSLDGQSYPTKRVVPLTVTVRTPEGVALTRTVSTTIVAVDDPPQPDRQIMAEPTRFAAGGQVSYCPLWIHGINFPEPVTVVKAHSVHLGDLMDPANTKVRRGSTHCPTGWTVVDPIFQVGELTDTVTLTFADNEGNRVESSNSFSWTVVAQASLLVSLVPTRTELPETGAYGRYAVTVTNTGTQPLTLQRLQADGRNLLNENSKVGTRCAPLHAIDPGRTFTCTFRSQSELSGKPGAKVSTQVDVQASDGFSTAWGKASVTQVFTDVLPDVTVSTTAPEKAKPGSIVPVTVTVLGASREWGRLESVVAGTTGGKVVSQNCRPGSVLAEGSTYVCTAQVRVAAGATSDQQVSARVSVLDDENNRVVRTGVARIRLQ